MLFTLSVLPTRFVVIQFQRKPPLVPPRLSQRAVRRNAVLLAGVVSVPMPFWDENCEDGMLFMCTSDNPLAGRRNVTVCDLSDALATMTPVAAASADFHTVPVTNGSA